MMDKIAASMDEARIPRTAQNMAVLEFDGGARLRAYLGVTAISGEGFCFVVANDFKKPDARLRLPEAKTLVHVFAKELILYGARVKIMNTLALADMLLDVTPWEDDFEPDRADHLILNNFFRSGQESPYTPRQLAKLIDYLGERHERGAPTHTFWEIDKHISEGRQWYPVLWTDNFWWPQNHIFRIEQQ